MKFVLMLVAAACAGALTMAAIPTAIVRSGAQDLRQFHLADLNPLRMIFDYEQQRIRSPLTPEETGFHGSAVVVTPITPPTALKLDLGQSFQSQATLQIQQNDRRMQDMQAYSRNPSQWVGPPPN